MFVKFNRDITSRKELDDLEMELMRRQSQSRSSEIKKIKDSHLQEFVDAENMWREKADTLQAKVILIIQVSVRNTLTVIFRCV